MLKLLLGRAGAGKSSAILRRIAGGEGRACLIVPEQASHEAERRLCAVGGDGTSLRSEVLSFTRMAARIFAQAGGGAAAELDAGGRILLMHRAVQSLTGQLTVYAKPSRKPEFLRRLLATSDELKSCRITPEALASAAEEAGREGEKLRDLALICGAYDAMAQQAGADPRDRLTRAAEALRRCDWGVDMAFYFDGFVDFTPQEREVLRLLLERAASVTVALTCDGLEGDDPSGVFSAARRTGRSLLRMAEEARIPCEVETLVTEGCAAAPLRHLERSLFAAKSAKPEAAEGHVTLFKADTGRGEAEWAAAETLRLVREQGWRFRDIGVAARSFEGCGDVVSSVFRRYGIPLFYAARTPVLQKPVFALVTAALDAASGGYQYDDVFRYLKSGLTPISADDCDRLENYVIKWDIKGSRWTQSKPWTMHPDGYGLPLTPEDEKLVAELDALRRTVTSPLERLRKSTARTGREQAVSLYRFMEEIDLAGQLERRSDALRQAGELNRAEEYRQLWDILAGALEQCAVLLDDTPIELSEFAALLKLVLSQYDVGAIPVALDRVTAGDLQRVTSHSLKALFILGADSTALPQVSEAPGLLSDEDRTLLASLGLEAASRLSDRLEREMTIIYQACACPSERLSVSWAGHDGEGGERQPSFLAERLRLLFSDLAVLDEAQLDGSFRLAAPLPALEQAGRDEGVRAALLQVEEYRPAAERVEEARRWQRGAMSRPAVEALYGPMVPMSASRMDKYKSCHFSYFMQYGLKAKPRSAAGFQAPEYGTFVHEVLEAVFRAAGEAGGVKALTEEQLQNMTDAAIENYVNQRLGGLQEESPRSRYLFRRLTGAVRAVVRNMADELRRSDFQPIAFELGFGRKGELPPVELTSNGVTVSISGFVDRVDGWEHDGKLYLRVVDYKTGRKSFDLTEVWNGLGLQMLLYLFTLGHEGEKLYQKEVVPAGVLYLPAREVTVSGSRAMTEEERRKKVDAALKRRGLLLDDEAVLAAMEHVDGKPRFLPVRVSAKTGELTGESLVSAQRLGRLERHIQAVLQGICRELAAGNIAADPFWRGPDKNACRFCDYAEACHFEEEQSGDRRRWLRPVSTEEFWRQIEEPAGEGGSA